MEITDAAAKQFKKLLSEAESKDSGVRIFVAGNGCCGPSFGMDISAKGKTGDELIENDGLKVYVEQKAFIRLSKATIDYNMENASFSIKGMFSSCCS